MRERKKTCQGSFEKVFVFTFFTFKFFISFANSMTSLVPCTLMSTASFKFSSNLTVAAAWKMMLMLLARVCLSVSERPSPAIEQSPATVTILWRNFGTVSRSFSNNCEKIDA